MSPSTRTSLAGLALVLVALAGTACNKKSNPTSQCKSNGASCSASSECCSGLSCPSGTCQALVTCKSAGAICALPSECCPGTGGCNPDGTGQTVCGPPQTCKSEGVSCTLPSECCSPLQCNGTCIAASQCNALGDACASDSNCCSHSCVRGMCVEPPGTCRAETVSCANPYECCSAQCNSNACGAPPPPTCAVGGDTCTADSECCSTVCSSGQCTSSLYCKNSGQSCVSSTECCSFSCVSGSCAAACATIGTGCSSGSQCCSGVCTSGSCAQVNPTVSPCTTLGNACTAGAECCSTNCQGGACVQAYSCNASGDICYRNQDCCSGLCSTGTIIPATTPGRCLTPSGGCGEDGTPCTGASNCCTRLCVDLGTGVSVCKPASGCRMTGNYCDSTNACCGGTPDEINPGGYGVVCAPKQVGAPKTCSNGQSCNPPGNICGGSGTVNASQNCCDGKKAVCKADSSGIMRCFGGCPNDNCSQCPTGYDPNNPGCCIQVGEVCQFSDQCCNGVPCVPDALGVLRCGDAAACKPQGDLCTGTAGTQDGCCNGLICTNVTLPTGPAKMCLEPTDPGGTCKPPGASCTTGPECCTGFCFEGVVCGGCAPDESQCSTGAECCSEICDPTLHVCVTPGGTACVQDGGKCTVNGDCCSPDTCLIQPGATSGTCTAPVGPPPTCALTSQSCSTLPCCSPTDVCDGGVCGPPPPTCSDVSQSCTSDASCCSGLQCFTFDPNFQEIPCGTSGTACFCDAPVCKNTGQPCIAGDVCCTGYCAENTPDAPACTSPSGCLCVDSL